MGQQTRKFERVCERESFQWEWWGAVLGSNWIKPGKCPSSCSDLHTPVTPHSSLVPLRRPCTCSLLLHLSSWPHTALSLAPVPSFLARHPTPSLLLHPTSHPDLAPSSCPALHLLPRSYMPVPILLTGSPVPHTKPLIFVPTQNLRDPPNPLNLEPQKSKSGLWEALNLSPPCPFPLPHGAGAPEKWGVSVGGHTSEGWRVLEEFFCFWLVWTPADLCVGQCPLT